MKKRRDRLIVFVTPYSRDFSRDYFHVSAGVGRLCDSGNEEDEQNIKAGYTWTTPKRANGLLIQNLRLTCQGNARNATDLEHLYGSDVTYSEVFSADRQECEDMARTLRTIDRKMRALTEKHGYARTYPEIVNRFAQAIGAVEVRARKVDHHVRPEVFTEREETAEKPGLDAIRLVESVCFKAIRKYGKALEKEVCA